MLLKAKETFPRMINLASHDQIKKVFDKSYAQTIHASRGGGVANIKNQAELYSLIWQPFDSLLTDVNTIYFAPAGILHQVAFSALYNKNKAFLINRYRLVQMNNTGFLLSEHNQIKLHSAVLFGGIIYHGESRTKRVKLSKDGQKEKEIDSERNKIWSFLPGTKVEVEQIQNQLIRENIKTKLLTGYQASETNFKTLGHLTEQLSPSILHVATHGYFQMRDTVNFQTDPLHSSGLVFAGANQVQAPDSKDDGFLTGYEVSQLNLNDTELVVLSACETGIGETVGYEGVYGLQRAFKKAGAKQLIMSLWKVPDLETQKMMNLFYKYWIGEKQHIIDAFRRAQLNMAENYSPFYWAAFVLIQ